ncbi:MAG TPA: hypothetical protein VK203_07850 [Nostocaceae cyanobacterium]|nr:hypothetical protein [Nostocaceae cyanobacterium]
MGRRVSGELHQKPWARLLVTSAVTASAPLLYKKITLRARVRQG